MLFGFTQGFSILMAQHFGAGDHRELSRTVGVSLTLTAVIAGLSLVGGQAAAEPVLRLVNTPEDIRPLALLYLRIVFAGIPAIAANNFLASILRALGDSKTPLYAMIGASLLNVGLDLLFVGGFRLGVFGAALATMLSQLLAGAGSLLYAFRRNPYFRLSRESLAFDRTITRNAVRLGLPLALQWSLIAISTTALQTVVNTFGPTAMAAHTSTNRLEQLVQQPFGSLSMALSTYSSQMSSMVTRMSRYFSADASKAVVVPNGRQQQLISIAVLICSIPLIILYIFTQKTFTESLAMSGSKE
jgi:putative MATE family efflux protein